MLRSFGGEFRKEARVSLAGRSRGAEETRGEVLERTRRERERRRQDKLEQKSATCIQASALRASTGRIRRQTAWAAFITTLLPLLLLLLLRRHYCTAGCVEGMVRSEAAPGGCPSHVAGAVWRHG